MGKASRKAKQQKKTREEKSPATSVPTADELGHGTTPRSAADSSITWGDTADVYIIVLKYSNDGSVFGKEFLAGNMVAVYCIHHQKPSVWHMIISKISEYIKTQHEEDNELPKTLSDLQSTYDSKLVVNGPAPGEKDNVSVGVPWLVAWYTKLSAEILKDLIIYLDGFVYWRASGASNESRSFPPGIPTIHITLPTELSGQIEFTTEDSKTEDGVIPKDMDCPITLTFADSSEMVNTFAQSPPFWMGRYCVANVEGNTTNTISIVWNGCLLPFKSNFDAEGIHLKSRDVGSVYPEYYRFLRDVNISEDSSWNYALSLFSDKIFEGSPIVVKIVKIPPDDTIFQQFVQHLKLMHHVHVEM